MEIAMLKVFDELLGFLALIFVLFIFLAGPVVIVLVGLLLPILMPVLIPVVVIFAILANLVRKYHDWLDRL